MRTASSIRVQARGTRYARLALELALFQGAWFACVVGAAEGHAFWGGLAAALAVGLLLAASDRRGADALLVATAVATGLVWDSALAFLGLVQYASPGPMDAVTPAWILALWALWGVVLRGPLRWLHGRARTAAVLGAASGALSYAAASRLGACRFEEPVLAMVVLALGWAAITPLHLALARRLDRGRERTR